MTLCPGCNQLRRYFWENDTIASGEYDQIDIFYFGDYLHIEKPKFHRLQKFENVARRIAIRLRFQEKLGLYIVHQWGTHLFDFKLRESLGKDEYRRT